MFGEMSLTSYKPYITTGEFSSGENKFLSQEVDDLLKKKNQRGKNKDVNNTEKDTHKTTQFSFSPHTYVSTHTHQLSLTFRTLYTYVHLR